MLYFFKIFSHYYLKPLVLSTYHFLFSQSHLFGVVILIAKNCVKHGSYSYTKINKSTQEVPYYLFNWFSSHFNISLMTKIINAITVTTVLTRLEKIIILYVKFSIFKPTNKTTFPPYFIGLIDFLQCLYFYSRSVLAIF